MNAKGVRYKEKTHAFSADDFYAEFVLRKRKTHDENISSWVARPKALSVGEIFNSGDRTNLIVALRADVPTRQSKILHTSSDIKD